MTNYFSDQYSYESVRLYNTTISMTIDGFSYGAVVTSHTPLWRTDLNAIASYIKANRDFFLAESNGSYRSYSYESLISLSKII